MTPSWGLIPKILSGEKTIESRWYRTRRVPWDGIAAGDTIFFKNSGGPVIAAATVTNVRQFTITDLAAAEDITSAFGNAICLPHPRTWPVLPRYCILVNLADARPTTPFDIDKRGFGGPAAWLTVDDIDDIALHHPPPP
jgi:hypothetical protein